MRKSYFKKWDYVLVYKLDRIARTKYKSTIHRKHLIDNRIKLLSAMETILETPEGVLLESLLKGVKQYSDMAFKLFIKFVRVYAAKIEIGINFAINKPQDSLPIIEKVFKETYTKEKY